jgi:Putative prokaryotic signal transducing protein
MDGEPTIFCPTCGRAHPPNERFCETCRMPLVNVADTVEPAASERQRAARKIKPEYAEGELVKVAHADDLAQAEFIAGLLLEEGIPSMLRGSIAGYAPLVDPRDIMVPESGAEAAREALAWPSERLGDA